MDLNLQGKVVLATGCAGVIGSCIARRFAEAGARVLMTDKDLLKGSAVAQQLHAQRLDVRFLEHDVADEESWNRIVQGLLSQEKRIDIVVNNAGVPARTGQPFDAIEYEEWRRVMSVNLDGVFLGTRAAVRAMKETGGGAIVNIGSVAGLRGSRGGAAYGSSKGGVHALTRQAAYSCAINKYNIRINSIAPTYVWSDFIAERAIKEHGSKEKAIQALSSKNPLGRMIEADDIASSALFLSSDRAGQINGIELVIDGGEAVHQR